MEDVHGDGDEELDVDDKEYPEPQGNSSEEVGVESPTVLGLTTQRRHTTPYNQDLPDSKDHAAITSAAWFIGILDRQCPYQANHLGLPRHVFD